MRFFFPTYLFRGLPLGELPQALLPRPNAGVDDLEEQLARSRVEDEDSPVDGLGRQVTLERLSQKKKKRGSAENIWLGPKTIRPMWNSVYGRCVRIRLCG